MRSASFVIRLWQVEAEDNASDVAWRGRVEHVQSGTTATVRSLNELTTFIEQRLAGKTHTDRKEEPRES